MGNAALVQKTCPTCGGAFDAEAVFCPKDGTKLHPEAEPPPDSDPYIGTVISGDIEIKTVLGAGAMGRVYRAHQRGIERDVAVKILHRELSGNAQLVQRFNREAKIASKLQHPHVVEVFLAGQLPDRAMYIVMEYLDGLSLAAALADAGGVFPLERALTIMLQICDAVGEGHARGIVHRDLKPENVMLVRRAEASDWVKVLDFGIAKVSLGEQSMETQAGLIFGTARYISPEGAQGTTVGPQGDVYSLAVMLYQLLAGKTPFDAEQPVGLLIKHIHEAPPPLRAPAGARDVPEPIVRVVMENLAKEPARRAPNARALATALAAAAKESNVSWSDVGVVARMSNVDLGMAARYASQVAAIEPTIDDSAGMRAPAVLPASLSPSPPRLVGHEGAPAIVPLPPDASLPPQISVPPYVSAPPPLARSSPAPEPARAPAHEATPPSRRAGKFPVLIVLLAFLLGAAVAVIVTRELVHRKDEDRSTYVAKARRAVSDSRYVNPPGDNVRDLVTEGLKRWPDDPDLSQIRSDAAHEMVTLSLAARTGGDVGGALLLVRDATLLDGSDQSAMLLVSQYERELANATAPTYAGDPKILFDVKPVAKKGQRLELVGRVIVGAAGPKARIEGTRITLYPNKATTGGTNVPTGAAHDAREVRASFVAPAPGSYDLIFESNVDGTPVRAMRDLEVVK